MEETLTFNSFGLRAAIVIDTAIFFATDRKFVKNVGISLVENEFLNWTNYEIRRSIKDFNCLRDARFFKFVQFQSSGQVSFKYYGDELDFNNIKRSNKIKKLLSNPEITYQALIFINNFLRLHNLKLITADDMQILVDFEKNQQKAFEKYGYEKIIEIAGKPLDPFKAEQFKIIDNELIKLKEDFVYKVNRNCFLYNGIKQKIEFFNEMKELELAKFEFLK